MDAPLAAQAAVTVAVVGLAAVLQRLSGFGFALLATPLLAFAMPVQDAVVVLALASLPTLALNWAELGRHADGRQILRLAGWAVPGMPLGLWVHHVVSDRVMRLVLAVTILAATLILVSGVRIRTHRIAAADAVAGFVSGLLNTSTGTNGPPLVLTLSGQDLPPDQMRATLAGTFGLSAVVAIALFVADGLVDGRILLLAGCGLPLMLVGRRLGAVLAGRLGADQYRRLTYGLLVATAVSSGVRALV
jgi:uncharacterized membrane protein YfcA